MMEQLWWTRLVNSVRLLDDVEDALRNYRSVVLCYDDELPWEDVMYDVLDQRVLEMTDSRTFKVLDVSGAKEPGMFLLNEFCREEERADYWPPQHKTPERFLAQNKSTPLNNRFVCLKGINSHTAAEWVNCVAGYVESCDADSEHGVFILLVKGAVSACPKELKHLKYADYVSDYDCMMLCLTLISEISCDRAEKMYLCELASNLAHNRVELAGILASEKLELVRDPYKVTERVFKEHGIDCELDRNELRESIERAIWEAQIKLVFPKIENFRAEIIRKYETRLLQFLPIKNSNNESITVPADLEIGQLYYIFGTRLTGKPEFDMLSKMRDARNKLAHWNPLPYQTLKELGVV